MTLEDVDLLQRISIETFTDTFGKDNTPEQLEDYLSQAYSRTQLTQELQEIHTEFILVTVAGEPAGYLKLNTEEAQSEEMGHSFLEIERIYVRKSFKHQRIGTWLLELAFKKARAKKKSAVWLGVWEHNQPAQAFYKKHGFIFHSQHIFYVGDDPQTDYILVKKIN
ncbi:MULTISPECIES: N-acetyltransferase [unclassified Enterococcus]|uniref:GNAT family N-acetyltransferase n=1 Tax=unclassified Enterococcus TaxID=2608891 RepID=UPI00197CE02E|nr:MULTISPECIES: N-acetyltransferase [unclassified Enterococcus]